MKNQPCPKPAADCMYLHELGKLTQYQIGEILILTDLNFEFSL